MEKLSKGDKIDKEQEQKDKEWLTQQKLCQHFLPGTYVIYNHERVEVLSLHPSMGAMVIRYDDGTWEIIRPFFMNRSSK